MSIYTYQLSCLGMSFMPVSLKLWSHTKSRLQTNFPRLTHKCELATFKVNDPFTTVTEKCITKLYPIWERNTPHVNQALIPDSQILKEKKPRRNCSFSVNPKHIVKLQNLGILQNILSSFQKSSEIVRSSSKTLTLCRTKISRLWLRKSWQV